MKMYTYYTPTHQIFYDQYFYPSLQKYFLNDSSNKLIVRVGEQKTANGSFNDSGFNLTDTDRVKFLIEANSKDECWIFSDVDITFYDTFVEEIKQYLNEYDIVGQSDNCNWFEICGGFFAVKPTSRTRQFWYSVLNEMQTTNVHNYQIAFMKCKRMYPDIKMQVLPETYWSVHRCGKGIWNPGVEIEIPKNIKMHHANYTVGVDNKIKLLNLVKEKYELQLCNK